jgi:hypothetical protein
MRSLLLVIVFTSVAHAGEHRFGFGASVLRAPNVGVSVVTGISEHHALHLRAARYRPLECPDEGADRVGRIYAASASWVVYSERVLEGFSFELGGFLRDTDRLGWSDGSTRRASEAIGVHGLVGYTLTLRDRLYVGFALGVSKWLEHGHDVDGPTQKPFVGSPHAVDGYFRIGWAFDA